MKAYTKLLFELQGITDVDKRKKIMKEYLSYYLPRGEELDFRRPVEICDDHHCKPKKEKCVFGKQFMEYWFCVSC